MNLKQIIKTSLLLVLVIATSTLTNYLINRDKAEGNLPTEESHPFQFASQSGSSTPTDFTTAAERSVESVVHVKVKIQRQNSYYGNNNPLLEFFFGIPSQPQREPQMQEGSGSGVIISSDGYIVTNNHVINNANIVEVVLNDKRTYEATVVGTDPSTDIALLKIEAENLQAIMFGNSDDLRIGEWVLAVGNPFNLTSTVTAGIVSAKARNINIIDAEMKIESFIQTDAAVNPGNSGGALVNTRGELIGINTAIASQTGSYSGYSFAVPTSIVAKVVGDLKEFSVVQRAVLGVQIVDIDDKLAKEKNLSTLQGVYVDNVTEEGSAADAGIKGGDVIVSINGNRTTSSAELIEQVSRYRPGDEIKIDYIRNNQSRSTTAKLKNKSGNTNLIKVADNSVLGAKFKSLDNKLREKYRLKYGIQIASLERNGALAKAGLTKDFIILKVNGEPIRSENELIAIVNHTINAGEQDRALFITGAYPNGDIAHFAVNLE